MQRNRNGSIAQVLRRARVETTVPVPLIPAILCSPSCSWTVFRRDRSRNAPRHNSRGTAGPGISDSQAQVETYWTKSVEATVFVPREAIECIQQEVRADRAWISVEGEAGTGKSTLLRRLHAHLTSIAGHGTDFLPLLVDAIWLLGANHFRETPLGPLEPFVRSCSATAWDSLLELGQMFAKSGVQLVLLVDTVDAVLLTPSCHRIAQWLGSEAARAGIRVVSCCRPLEAHSFLSPYRFTLELSDFSLPEAQQAINAYVESLYKRYLPRTAKQGAANPAGILSQAAVRGCLPPPNNVEEMLSSAYPDRPPPEDIGRHELFNVY